MMSFLNCAKYALMITMLFICSCKPTSKTIPNNKTKPHPTINKNVINHNQTLITGHWVKHNKQDYIQIDTIHARGNSAAVVSIGERILINLATSPKPKKEKTVKGILTSNIKPQGNIYEWTFKSIND